MTLTLKTVNQFFRLTHCVMIVLVKNGGVVQEILNRHNQTHGQNYRQADGQMDKVISISPEPLNHLKKKKKIGIVVYHHEEMRHAEKLVHHLQCQGHSEGLYNQNMTIFTISSKLLVHLQPNLV